MSNHLIESRETGTLRPRLLNHDAALQFQHLETITQVHLRLHKSRLELLNGMEQSLPSAFRHASEEWGADVIEVVLKSGTRRRANLGQRAWDFVRELIGLQDQLMEGADLFKVRGRDDRSRQSETFDFLSDKLVSTVRVTKQAGKYRAVDSGSMFTQIEDAYNQMKDTLGQSLGVEL